MPNKITYGLEDVHIAFKGVAQAKSIEVTNGCTTDGEVTVTITGAPLGGGTEACVVPLSTESHSTVAKVASAIVNVLNNNADVGANYTASNLGGLITLAAKVVAANDATLNITVTAGTTGVTVGAAADVTAGVTGWGTPTSIPGAVRFTPTTVGQESTFYADNGPYFTVTANNGYTAELELTLLPDTVLKEMLGWQIDSNGMIVEIADAMPKHFALLGQIQGDVNNRRFVYYDCVAARPNKELATKGETVEPQTDTLNVTISPIEIDGRDVVMGVMELGATNVAAYNAFFTAVTLPVLGA